MCGHCSYDELVMHFTLPNNLLSKQMYIVIEGVRVERCVFPSIVQFY